MGCILTEKISGGKGHIFFLDLSKTSQRFLYLFYKFYIFSCCYLSNSLPPIVWIIVLGSSLLTSLLKVNSYFQLEIYSLVAFPIISSEVYCMQAIVSLTPSRLGAEIFPLLHSIWVWISWQIIPHTALPRVSVINSQHRTSHSYKATRCQLHYKLFQTLGAAFSENSKFLQSRQGSLPV